MSGDNWEVAPKGTKEALEAAKEYVHAIQFLDSEKQTKACDKYLSALERLKANEDS